MSKKKAKAPVPKVMPTPHAVMGSSESALTSPWANLSTRDHERPKGSIRIVPGRKDAK